MQQEGGRQAFLLANGFVEPRSEGTAGSSLNEASRKPAGEGAREGIGQWAWVGDSEQERKKQGLAQRPQGKELRIVPRGIRSELVRIITGEAYRRGRAPVDGLPCAPNAPVRRTPQSR